MWAIECLPFRKKGAALKMYPFLKAHSKKIKHQRCTVFGIPPLVCAHLQLCRKSRLFLKIVLK
jgi:hypothetical protein